jgi:hypothetical protein
MQDRNACKLEVAQIEMSLYEKALKQVKMGTRQKPL